MFGVAPTDLAAQLDQRRIQFELEQRRTRCCGTSQCSATPI
jgi:hypothetical protein